MTLTVTPSPTAGAHDRRAAGGAGGPGRVERRRPPHRGVPAPRGEDGGGASGGAGQDEHAAESAV